MKRLHFERKLKVCFWMLAYFLPNYLKYKILNVIMPWVAICLIVETQEEIENGEFYIKEIKPEEALKSFNYTVCIVSPVKKYNSCSDIFSLILRV